MITQLYERFIRTSLLIQNLNGCSQLLELGSKLCKDDINKKIDMAIQRLLERKNVLKEDMIRIRVEKSDKLDQQLQVLRSYQRELEDGKKVYEKTIADSSLDVHTRKKRIIGLVNELTGRKDIQLTLVTQPKLRLGYENQMLTTFLEQLGIDDCDQPYQPGLKIAKISFDSIALELTCDDEVLVHKVIEYAVEIALIHTNSKQKPAKRKLNVGKKKKSKDKDKDKDKDKEKKKRRKKARTAIPMKDSEENSDEDKDSEEEDEKESEENSEAEDSDEKEESAEEESEEQSDEDDKKKKKKKNKDKDKEKEKGGDDTEPKEEKKDKTEVTSTTPTAITSGESTTKTDTTDTNADKEKEPKKEKTEVVEAFDINNVDMSKLEWELASVVEVPEKYLEVGRYNPSRKYHCVIKQLLDQSDYAVRARAKNKSGWGDFCNPQIFTTKKLIIDSKILKPEEKKQLLRWLPTSDRKKRWKLMFRASKHGFGASQFHAKLDNKSGTTVTVIQSTMNHVFGGYTSIAWTSSGNYASDNNSWIFLLRAGKNVTPKKGKWKVTQTQYSVYHGGGNGPTFGGGYDFTIANAANTNTSSYANAGHSYACPKNNTLLAGQYNFMVKDFEV
ncbi:hypothetical protein RFI_11202 [Reticulomyxa filosa]|uniref:Oxidation resistance protein 1 n=1 Tax=Reticulomyxa filosa TaxID=46433 RepID=X6NIZ0_RETFI|nr:hypothetical protein RFI_11202 [Reticulomyxa filosa]|eukprot:ETO25936.1 hypothetical protein RFI_11202 [Reticulomyxa filosa]